jgi:hypothetical protein
MTSMLGDNPIIVHDIFCFGYNITSFSFLYPLLSNANLELMFFGADFLPGRVWPVLLRVPS